MALCILTCGSGYWCISFGRNRSASEIHLVALSSIARWNGETPEKSGMVTSPPTYIRNELTVQSVIFRFCEDQILILVTTMHSQRHFVLHQLAPETTQPRIVVP